MYTKGNNDLQLECMLWSDRLLHEEDLHAHKELFLCQGAVTSLYWVSSRFCQAAAHHTPYGQKDDHFLQPARGPVSIHRVGEAVPVPVSTLYLQKGAAASWTFCFPRFTGICTICATLTCNGRFPKQIATDSIFISAFHTGFGVQWQDLA